MGKMILKEEKEDNYVFFADGPTTSAHMGKTYNVQLKGDNFAE